MNTESHRTSSPAPYPTFIVKLVIAMFINIKRLNLYLGKLDRIHKYFFGEHKKIYLTVFWLCAITAFGLPFILKGAFWFLPAGLFFYIACGFILFFSRHQKRYDFYFF